MSTITWCRVRQAGDSPPRLGGHAGCSACARCVYHQDTEKGERVLRGTQLMCTAWVICWIASFFSSASPLLLVWPTSFTEVGTVLPWNRTHGPLQIHLERPNAQVLLWLFCFCSLYFFIVGVQSNSAQVSSSKPEPRALFTSAFLF